MEHLSRRTTQNVDALLLVSNHSVKGVRTIGRIEELVSNLKLVAKKQLAIINMVPSTLDPLVKEEMDRLGIELTVVIPEDEEVYRYDLEMKPLLDLPDTSKAVKAVDGLMGEILDKATVAT